MTNKEINEVSIEQKRKDAILGNKIFCDIIERKNKDNEYYNYEILATTNEFSPYDIQIQKHNNDDWGDYQTTYHEIKVRASRYSYHQFTHSYIDLHKIQQLQKISYLTGNDVYVNMIFLEDNTMLIWKIEADREYDTRYENNVSWKSASLATNEDIRIEKNFVLLPNDEAVKIKY